MTIFQPFREIGMVCDKTPLSVQKMGSNNFITASIGNSFHVYDSEKLKLVCIGQHIPLKLYLISSLNEFTIASSNNILLLWKRQKLVGYENTGKGEIIALKSYGAEDFPKLFGEKRDFENLPKINEFLIIVAKKTSLHLYKICFKNGDNSILATKIDNSNNNGNNGGNNESKGDNNGDEGGNNEKIKNEDENSIEMEEMFNITLDFKVSENCIERPFLYRNKLLIGYENGTAELMRLGDRKPLYTFAFKEIHKKFGNQTKNVSENGGENSLTVISSSSIKNVVGFAFKNGSVVVLDIKFYVILVEFSLLNAFATSLSFCQTKNKGYLATCSNKGNVSIWSLNDKKLVFILKNAHASTVLFLNNKTAKPPLKKAGSTNFVTSGADNALKIWRFDPTTNSAAILKQRSGHCEAPSLCQFYSDSLQNDGLFLMSASADRSLRCLSASFDELNVEMSQGKLAHKAKRARTALTAFKLHPITCLSACKSKEREWGNVLTGHESVDYGVVWSFEKKSKTKIKLRYGGDKLKDNEFFITAVKISFCGNFAVLGTSNGLLYKSNIQSGDFKGSFIDHSLNNNKAHLQQVSGVNLSALNKYAISVSFDGTLKWWDFESFDLKKEIKMSSKILKSAGNNKLNMLAVANENREVILFDSNTMKKIRTFGPHLDHITAIVFSSDSRWLITSAKDYLIRVFDIPNGCLVDWFRVETPVSSMDFSADSRFLATTSPSSFGITLWMNRCYYTDVYLNRIDTNKIPNELDIKWPKVVNMNSNLHSQSGLEREKKWKEKFPNFEQIYGSLNKKERVQYSDRDFLLSNAGNDKELAAYSGTSLDKWTNLAFIDMIKERNKPSDESIKTIEETPFFIPTVFDGANGESNKKEKIKIELDKVCETPAFFQNKLVSLLCNNTTNKNTSWDDKMKMAMDYIKKTGPSSLDLSIRLLEGKEEINVVLKFFIEELERFENFEVISSLLHLFLKTKGSKISEFEDDVHLNLTKILELQKEKGDRFEDDVNEAMCLLRDSVGVN